MRRTAEAVSPALAGGAAPRMESKLGTIESRPPDNAGGTAAVAEINHSRPFELRFRDFAVHLAVLDR